ncbi:hypothetical protein D3C72_1787640 [compost metagenome]
MRLAPLVRMRSAALMASVVVLPVPASALTSTALAVVLSTSFCSSVGYRFLKVGSCGKAMAG